MDFDRPRRVRRICAYEPIPRVSVLDTTIVTCYLRTRSTYSDTPPISSMENITLWYVYRHLWEVLSPYAFPPDRRLIRHHSASVRASLGSQLLSAYLPIRLDRRAHGVRYLIRDQLRFSISTSANSKLSTYPKDVDRFGDSSHAIRFVNYL